MKYWITKYTGLYTSATSAVRVCWMDVGTIVNLDLVYPETYGRVKVVYKASKEFVGWVSRKYIEELDYEFPSEGIAKQQTVSEQDAAQYLTYDSAHVLYNLCGEMCVAWIFGEDIQAFQHNFLNRWKSRPTSRFNQIIFGGKSRTTGVDDLLDMAACYPSISLSMKEALWDKDSESYLFTPRRLQNVLAQGWKGIFGVRIEGRRGEVRWNGTILHWIVVSDIQPHGINDAWVTIYNPFTDRCKRISWYDLTSAMSIPSGVFLRNPSL